MNYYITLPSNSQHFFGSFSVLLPFSPQFTKSQQRQRFYFTAVLALDDKQRIRDHDHISHTPRTSFSHSSFVSTRRTRSSMLKPSGLYSVKMFLTIFSASSKLQPFACRIIVLSGIIGVSAMGQTITLPDVLKSCSDDNDRL